MLTWLAAILCSVSWSEIIEDQWTLISRPDTLTKLYSLYDACILQHQGDCPSPAAGLEEQCSGFYSRDESLREIFTNKSTSFPQSLYQIPSSHDAQYLPKLSRITDLLIALNESNMMLAMWGDSVMRDSVMSLICIVGIENKFQGVTVNPPDIISRGGSSMFLRPQISFVHPTTATEVSVTVFMYQEKGTKDFQRKNAYAEMLLAAEAKRVPNMSFLFVLNTGLHVSGYDSLAKRIETLLVFAQRRLMQLGKNCTRNVMLFRETSTQHYDHQAGYFTADLDRAASEVMCVSSPSRSLLGDASADYRHRAEEDMFSKLKIKESQVVRFRELSMHFGDIHPASPFYKAVAKRRNDTGSKDCTHFPFVHTIIYRVLWHRILSGLGCATTKVLEKEKNGKK